MTTAACPIDARYPDVSEVERPYPLFERLRREEPVRQVPGRPHYLVTRYEDIEYVLTHPDLFSSVQSYSSVSSVGNLGHADVPSSLIETDAQEHRRRRRLCYGPFTPRRMRACADVIHDIAHELVDRFAQRGRCNFTREFAKPLPVFVMCQLMGLPRSDYDWLEKWGSLEVGLVYMSEAQAEQQLVNGTKMGTYLHQAVMARYARRTDDIISELITAQIDRDGTFDPAYITSETAVLLAGGVITTGHLLASAMVLLLQHPAQLAAVRADRSLVQPMLEEALRLEAPVQWNPRRVTRDTVLGGVSISAGSLVLVVYGSGNRDSERFAEPDIFDIARPNVSEHLSFGRGGHFCLGAPLARLEASIGFSVLLDRVTDIRLDETSDLRHLPSPNFRAPRSVHIAFRQSEGELAR
jgi:cytochrome P450